MLSPSLEVIGLKWWFLSLMAEGQGRLASIIGRSTPLLATFGFLLINIRRLPQSVGGLWREGGKTVPLIVSNLDDSIFGKRQIGD